MPREGVAPGLRLGSATLLAAVGSGSSGRVWAARRDDGSLVAVKTLLSHLSDVTDVKRAFDDLMDRLAGVRDPHLCAVLESGIDEEILYVTSEWVDGESAHRLLSPDDVPHAMGGIAAARIVADAAAGVHTLHEETAARTGAELVHGDLSARNLLVGADGRSRVADLGVSAALALAAVSTETQPPLSPEIVLGLGLDRRTDVFGLGCVLYELSTGVHPLAGLKESAAYEALRTGGVPPPSRHVAGYPPELEAIVLQALAFEPSERLRSAAALRDALTAWLERASPSLGQQEVAGLVRTRAKKRMETRRARIDSARAVWGGEGDGKNPSRVGPASGLRPVQPEIDLLNPPIPGPAPVPVVPMPRARPSVAPAASTKRRRGSDGRRFALGVLVGFVLFLAVAIAVFVAARSFGLGPAPEHPAPALTAPSP